MRAVMGLARPDATRGGSRDATRGGSRVLFATMALSLMALCFKQYDVVRQLLAVGAREDPAELGEAGQGAGEPGQSAGALVSGTREDAQNVGPTWDVHQDAWAADGVPAELEALLTVPADLEWPDKPVACLQPDRYQPFSAQYKALNVSVALFPSAYRSLSEASVWARCTVVHAAVRLPGPVPERRLASHLVGGHNCISGSKAVQYECRRRAAKADGCQVDDFGVMPRTFSLNWPADCQRFLRFAQSAEFAGSYWLEKPTKFDSHGSGQRLLSPTDMRAWLVANDCSRPRPTVLVEYLADPIQVQRRKIDLRTYVLVASAEPLLVFAANGFARVADVEYDLKSKDLKAHITNLVQQHDKLFKVNFSEAEALLEREGYEPGLLDGPFRERADRIAVFALEALRRTPAFAGAMQARRFALLALDFVINADGVAQLVEGNAFPRIDPENVGYAVYDSALRLALQVHANPRALIQRSWTELTVANNYWFDERWKLILNDLEQRLTGKPLNTCDALRIIRDSAVKAPRKAGGGEAGAS